MTRAFLDMFDDKTGTSEDETKSSFDKILKQVSNGNNENVLGQFAMEFAEGRANLNKEQAFFYLALYQYSVNRKQLLELYLRSMKEQHPDTRRRRAIGKIRSSFADYTTPCFPKQFLDNIRDIETESKPLQIL